MPPLSSSEERVALLAARGGPARSIGHQRLERGGERRGPNAAQLPHVRHVEEAGGRAHVPMLVQHAGRYCTGIS